MDGRGRIVILEQQSVLERQYGVRGGSWAVDCPRSAVSHHARDVTRFRSDVAYSARGVMAVPLDVSARARAVTPGKHRVLPRADAVGTDCGSVGWAIGSVNRTVK